MWGKTVKEGRTEAVSGITKTIANISEQNFVTKTRMYPLPLVLQVTARAFKDSFLPNFSLTIGSRTLDVQCPEKGSTFPFSDRLFWASAPPALLTMVAEITVTEVS